MTYFRLNQVVQFKDHKNNSKHTGTWRIIKKEVPFTPGWGVARYDVLNETGSHKDVQHNELQLFVKEKK